MKQNNGNFEVDLLSTIYRNNNGIRGWVSEIRCLTTKRKKTKVGKKLGGGSIFGPLGKIHHRVHNFFPDPPPCSNHWIYSLVAKGEGGELGGEIERGTKHFGIS